MGTGRRQLEYYECTHERKFLYVMCVCVLYIRSIPAVVFYPGEKIIVSQTHHHACFLVLIEKQLFIASTDNTRVTKSTTRWLAISNVSKVSVFICNTACQEHKLRVYGSKKRTSSFDIWYYSDGMSTRGIFKTRIFGGDKTV